MGPVTKNTEEITLPQSFDGRICLQESQASETRKSGARKTLARSGIRVGTLKQAGLIQSVGADGMDGP